jgi:phosphoribosylcarboxyaminoimidazole (NCAIR) mutase
MLVLEPESAALAAAKILAIADPALGELIATWQAGMREQALADDRDLQSD